MVSECEVCNRYKISQQKESLMTHDPNESERPFQKIGVDLMSIGNREFLITVDYYSSYWEVDGWMDERCFRPLLCTVKAELGRGQHGLMR